jgi:hypothetical protein
MRSDTNDHGVYTNEKQVNLTEGDNAHATYEGEPILYIFRLRLQPLSCQRRSADLFGTITLASLSAGLC